MNALIRYDAARRALAEAETILEAKEVRDKAEGLRAYARLAKDRELEIDALEIRLRAERRVGEMLLDIKAAGGLDRTLNLRSSSGELRGDGLTLEALGIDKKLSMRAQQYAAVPAEEFERRLAEWREQMVGQHARVVASLLKAVARPAPAAPPPLPDGKFRVIYPDPPWGFETWGNGGKDRGAENHYPTMATDEIAAIDVGSLAADDCALLLWVPGWLLAAGWHLPIIEAWGFKVSTVAFVWVKTDGDGGLAPGGLGYSTRAQSEFCLLARRGRPERLAKDVPQVIMAPAREHSRKPDEAYDRIERLFPGPYLELFARHRRSGWGSWGNEFGDHA